ncbi:sigma-54-dependent transcriptional regulator [Syntrophomonas curvata]
MDILIVDDEARSRLHTADFLRKMGHHVVEASNGQEALNLISAQRFNMLLTDNRMPQMSGLDLLRQLSLMPEARNMDKVLFTAFADMDSSIAAIRSGAFDYLLKPLDVEELVRTTERVARHQVEINETNDEDSVCSYKNNENRNITINPSAASGNTVGIYSKGMKNIFALALKLHYNRSIPVLIEGETGTGKELVARYIHYGDEREQLPFIALNCAALPAHVFESELFGYEPGTFSGGLPRGKQGKLDMARGGTLFMDEISELPLDQQAKLLRVIQEKEFYRVGGLSLVKTDVRIICASNQNLKQLVRQGAFRQDLYYRLNTGYVFVPPLREQPEAILPLARLFMAEISEQSGRRFRTITPEAARIMESCNWPGNIRELRNVIEWIVLMCDDTRIKASHLSSMGLNLRCDNYESSLEKPLLPDDFFLPADAMPLHKLSDDIILRALKMHNGNKTAVARYLGIARSTLYYRLQCIANRNN